MPLTISAQLQQGKKPSPQPHDGRGAGRGVPGGQRGGRNIGPCSEGGPGYGQGQGRGRGRGRQG